MKIAVIGAGMLGISMAHELVKDGHEVTIFESKASVAEGSSFANAGVMSCALTHPDISSWLFNSTFRSVLGSSYGLHVHKSFSLKQWTWLIKRSGGHVADPLSTDHLKWKSLLGLARLSAEQFDLTNSDLQLSFDGQKGQLILLRTESDQRSLTTALSHLQSEGLSFKLLDADDTYRLEPALQTDTPLFGALHLPEDQIANCRQLAQLLKQQCEKLQAKFVFQVGVNALKTIPEGVELQLSNDTSASFKAAVVCSGVKAADL
ncbi:MAG: FAD-dependent oxidoreductase, partial [Betaproteobacteria bacterium]|nr:FAD-dependent oxidoreductase [Betaproteobacteria bacterium]